MKKTNRILLIAGACCALVVSVGIVIYQRDLAQPTHVISKGLRKNNLYILRRILFCLQGVQKGA